MFLNLTTMVLTTALGGEPINTACPVSGRPVEPGHTATVGDATVGFCCPKCSPAFARWSDGRKEAWIARQTEDPAEMPEMPSPPKAYAGSATGPYLLDTCLITQKKLGSMGGPAIAMIDGREVRFCCMPCKPKFEADKAALFKTLDARLAASQRRHYPLTTDVVSGAPLGDSPVEMIHDNRLFRFSTQASADTFKQHPAKYIPTVDDAIVAAQRPNYPMTTCPIGKGPLDGMGGPVNMIVGNRLILLCCDSCRTGVLKDPPKVITQLDKAAAAAGS